MSASRSARRRAGSAGPESGQRGSRRDGKRPPASAAQDPAKAAVSPAAAPASSRAALARLALAGLAALLFLSSARLGSPRPWSYDEYYHLGVAREMTHHFPLRSFPWTPYSVLADHFADKDFLFHM